MPYELPPLPYSYDALEPYYDEQTVRLHHDKHHAGYVAGLNKALDELATARAKGDYALIKHWERELAFHGSGHVLHTLFWENMTPNGGGQPSGKLAEQIVADFGGFEAFKSQFSAAANAVEGSGWCVLGWIPALEKLTILQIEKHQDLTIWGVQPLLIIDVWEHAYYLKYQNRRAEWINNWWNIVHWADVGARFER
jgi:Fe-Mn family superoxide dismutase